MFENQVLTEVIARCKSEDLRRDIDRALLISLAGAEGGFHPRRAVAGVLMRIATVIDSNATRGGAAAPAH